MKQDKKRKNIFKRSDIWLIVYTVKRQELNPLQRG